MSRPSGLQRKAPFFEGKFRRFEGKFPSNTFREYSTPRIRGKTSRPPRGRFVYFFAAGLLGCINQACLPKKSRFYQAVLVPP